jgi:colanic acid/amylovoran biosynthesis glycosyltransferase
MDSPAPTVVIHRVRHWLPQTKTWIFEQLRWLPAEIEAHVSCDHIENLAQFPFNRLHVLDDASAFEQKLDRAGRSAHIGAFRSTARVAHRLSGSVLHSHFGPEAWRELGIARAAGIPQVVTFYGHDVTRVPAGSAKWRRRYLELFERVALVLCEGPHMRGELLRLGAPAHKVRVQHLGVNLEGLPFSSRVWSGVGPIKVLMAAGFREKKGLTYALRAVAAAQLLRPGVDLQVTVIGDASSDDEGQREKRAIVEAAAALRAGTVAFLGFRTHAQLLATAAEHHVFISPSVRASDGDTEGGAPVALIEIAALGVPVISTTHCDIPNVLRGPATALLAPERDIDGLTERLLGLVDCPERAVDITTFVRRELEERFDARKQARRLADMYLELNRRSRPQLALISIDAAERVTRRVRSVLGS